MLSARGSRELRAAGLALKLVERDVRNSINRSMRAEMNPVWRGAVAERAVTPLDRRVLNTGVRVAPGTPPVLYAATSSRPIRRGTGGLVPAAHWHAVEFGANREKLVTYRRRNRKGGGTHQVSRRVQRGLPARVPRGRVLMPAAVELAPRLAALYVQTVVRGVMDAAEGRRS